jgi:hypothetical protein
VVDSSDVLIVGLAMRINLENLMQVCKRWSFALAHAQTSAEGLYGKPGQKDLQLRLP